MKTRQKPRETILITGAGGYIGAIATKELLKSGYRVKALDTFYWGLEPLKDLSAKIEIIKCDIRDAKADVLKGVENVIHTAGLSNDPMADFNPKANFQINAEATIRFAKICKESSIKKFIFASSASIYDSKNSAKVLQDENSKVSPKAAYSVSKLQAERGILKLASKNFCPIIFRQGTVYGYSPKLRYDLVVNTMVKDALQSGIINVYQHGVQWRPLVDVVDVARAYILALKSENPDTCGQIFNLRYKNYTVLELSRVIKRTLELKFNIKVKLKIENGSKVGRNYKISGDKLYKVFKWRPVISPENSAQNLVVKIRKNKNTDFTHPRYYNIEWMKLLTHTQEIVKGAKRIF